MNERCSIGCYKQPKRILLGLIALLLVLLAPPMAALAHPADVYLQATYITVAPSQIVVELDLSPGVLVAPQVLPQLDKDSDQQIDEDESRTYVDAMLQNVVLKVDGKPLTLELTKIDMPPYLNIQAGYGTIRIFTLATLTGDMAGTHQISYTNNFAQAGSAYQVNAFVDKGIAITLGKQNRDSLQQSMTMDYAINAAPNTTLSASTSASHTTATTADLNTSIAALSGGTQQAQHLMAYLYEPVLSPWVLLLGLSLAVLLGGLHALTPGHGKTLVAAYLVGSRGTVRHAIALGAILTFTHTASVIIIGLLALFASQFIVPDVLVPILGILSGLLVVILGIRLVWQRWIAFHNHQSFDHHHSQHHDHRHTDDHSDDHTHMHMHHHGGGHIHSHLPPEEGVKLGSLLAMGVSGGLVPCPEALGIMVIAIGLNRILLGLGLIVSFSFGLAAVLIIIGILLVRSRSVVERIGGISGRWSRVLPLASAVIVTALGVGITLSGLATYLG